MKNDVKSTVGHNEWFGFLRNGGGRASIERKGCAGECGFSLLEIMLVLGVATGLLLLAFMMNKSRQDSVAVEDARRQVTKIVSSLEPVKNTLNSFGQVIPETGLTSEQKRVLLPKELFDAEGNLRSSFGAVELNSLSLNSASDAYAISYMDTSANFCAQLASKTYDQFYQVRVGGQLDLSDATNVVWTSGENFDPEIMARMCSGLTGQRVLQFVSSPLKGYNGTASSVMSGDGNALVPITLEQALVSAGAVTGGQSLPAVAPPVTTIGDLDIGAGYTPIDVGAGSGVPPPGANGTCGAGNFTWGGGCYGAAPGGTVTSGSTIVVGNSASGYIGGLQVSCNNGSWAQGTGTCFPAGCASTSRSWGGGCGGNLPNALSGNGATINSTTGGGYSGSASFSCYLGTWTIGSSTCNPPIPPDPSVSGACGPSHNKTLSVAPSSGLCVSGTASGVSSGSTKYTWSCLGSGGGSTMGCEATKSVVAPGGVNCTAVAGPLAWGPGCGATINQPVTPSGTSVTVTNTNNGYTGDWNFLCNSAGVWQDMGQTCTPNVVPTASCEKRWIWKGEFFSPSTRTVSTDSTGSIIEFQQRLMPLSGDTSKTLFAVGWTYNENYYITTWCSPSTSYTDGFNWALNNQGLAGDSRRRGFAPGYNALKFAGDEFGGTDNGYGYNVITFLFGMANQIYLVPAMPPGTGCVVQLPAQTVVLPDGTVKSYFKAVKSSPASPAPECMPVVHEGG